jgi:hypothetical protein
MRATTISSSRNAPNIILRACAAAFLLAFIPVAAVAQYNEKVTDGTTPSGLASGSPAGSYSLSGFESVNPYNGGLNFSLPLLQVGGRGGAGYSIKLSIDQKWLIRKEINPGSPNQYFPTPRWVDEYGAMEQTWAGSPPVSRGAATTSSSARAATSTSTRSRA